jgi:fructose-1,6-bisphosphatase/inositol monophosphatase family enzyme
VDIVIEADLKPHDFCALIPIIEGAGGIITDWEGNPLTSKSNGNVLACGAPHLHKKILKLLK